ncbi:hypothetical protein B0A49_03334 [Cryomyces minteri]|uniref:Pheromone alpha factor receptor n=1 Tax=Cryomyces minteri TaxID=331657 RepID=A0A4U0XJ00_9PEZI|nr:hypothetical protein B0A49_03334 [Cryomyces minteri]
MQPFDPFSQSFTLLAADGTPFNVSMSDVNDYVSYGGRILVNYSSQIGASALLLVVLLLLTKHEKRSSPIFILNSISLTLNTMRSILQCLYFTGPFYSFYAYFASDYTRVPKAQYGVSIAGVVFTFLLLVCIEVSLILQMRVVCVTSPKLQRFWITMSSTVVALLALGFRLALLVENARSISSLDDFGAFQWLASASNITTTISICFFCIVFCTKLGLALRRRSKLGLSQFGPMQIIFIMGCQTLIIPAVFSLLQYAAVVPELSSQVPTLVALFLPLSSMWASVVIEPNNRAVKKAHDGHRMFFGSWTPSNKPGNNSGYSKESQGTTDSDAKSLPCPITGFYPRDQVAKTEVAHPTSQSSNLGSQNEDLEMQKLDIRAGDSYIVSTNKH